MISDSKYAKTLQLIYDAGLDFDHWPAALEQLADMLDASMTCLVRHDVATSDGAMITVRTDPDTSRLYAAHYAKLNVFAQRAGRRPAATCMTDRSVLAKEELFRSEFYTDFLRPRDVHSILSVYLLREGATRIAFGRPHRAGEWGEREIERLNRFAPHLHRAAEMNVRLEGCRLIEDAVTGALDDLAQGVIVVDADSRPVLVNRHADQILSEADGLGIDSNGLCAAQPDENAALRRMMAAAANRQPEVVQTSALSVSRPSTRRPLSLMVAPLRSGSSWFLPRQSGAIVFIDKGLSEPSPAAAGDRQRDRLTAAHPGGVTECHPREADDPARPMRATSPSYVFGPFRLDTETQVLFRGSEPVALGLRAAAVLSLLLQHAGPLVSKDALIEAAWPGRAVQDSNLTVQIAALRRVLAKGGAARWIETLPRRGYRFVGPSVTRNA